MRVEGVNFGGEDTRKMFHQPLDDRVVRVHATQIVVAVAQRRPEADAQVPRRHPVLLALVGDAAEMGKEVLCC